MVSNHEKLVEMDLPAMIHVTSSCNRNFHHTGAHYINGDTTAFMAIDPGRSVQDFPTLRFVIPHAAARCLSTGPLSRHVPQHEKGQPAGST